MAASTILKGAANGEKQKAIKAKIANGESLMLPKLALSGLDATDAKALMMKPANKDELQMAGFPAKQAFEIPYFTAEGRPTKFKRWRYLEDTRNGFASKTDAKPLRYIQLGGTVSEIYLPPFVDWSAIQKSATIELVITEGELKAACCTKYVAPCIGLGGVYSFKSVKKKLPLLPILYEFDWKGRRVVIAFDSDAHTNPMVVMARNELCRELLALGALPCVADVLPAEDGAKRGLDDLYVQDGEDALRQVLDDAEPYAPSAALHELNTEVAYIQDPGIVVVMESGLRMRASDFTGHAYANRHYWEQSLDAKGNDKFTKKPAASAWLQWPLRLELSKIAYEPGKERITEGGEFNIWPGWGCQPVKGDVTPWKQLMSHLFGVYSKERDWFERWCALPLQQPGAKMFTACVLWGVMTGTGKSLVGYTLGRIYGKNFTEIGDNELQDDRNEWAISKQFVMGDDVTGQEQRKYSDKLKKMITQQEMRIDQKYIPSYTVKDRINYLFTSNHPDAFFLEDDDRRNFVHEVEDAPLPREFYKAYMDWLRNGGASALFYYMLHLNLQGMDAEDRAPNTSAKMAMIDDGLSDLGKWVRRLRDDPDTVLAIGDVAMKGDLWPSTELLLIYDPEKKSKVTAGGVAKELKRAGFRMAYNGMPVKTTSGQHRLFVVRNQDEWDTAMDLKKLAVHYNETRGGVGKKKKF
jgi:hypothetical protein